MGDSGDLGRDAAGDIGPMGRDAADQVGGMSRDSTSQIRDIRVDTTERSAAQTTATAAGILFMPLGILGFIPGITTHLRSIRFSGPNSGAMLFGVFQTSWVLNIVLILIGLGGLVAAGSWSTARGYLIGSGVLLLVFWLFGLIIRDSSSANFMPFNTSRDWLNFVLGLGLIGLGTLTARSGATARVPAKSPEVYGH